MKTTSYNPSPLEVDLAKGLCELQSQLEQHLDGNKIETIENKIQQDNPMVVLKTQDQDGDPHEIVIKIIQRPDQA